MIIIESDDLVSQQSNPSDDQIREVVVGVGSAYMMMMVRIPYVSNCPFASKPAKNKRQYKRIDPAPTHRPTRHGHKQENGPRHARRRDTPNPPTDQTYTNGERGCVPDQGEPNNNTHTTIAQPEL